MSHIRGKNRFFTSHAVCSFNRFDDLYDFDTCMEKVYLFQKGGCVMRVHRLILKMWEMIVNIGDTSNS